MMPSLKKHTKWFDLYHAHMVYFSVFVHYGFDLEIKKVHPLDIGNMCQV